MNRKKSIITLAVLLVSSLFLFTSCKGHRNKGAFMMDYFSEALDLTAEQQEDLSAIHSEILTQLELVRKNKKEMYSILKSQLSGEEIDKELVRQLIAEHRTEMDTVIDLAVDRLAEFHTTLSVEQKEKLVAKLDKLRHLREDSYHH